MAFEYLEELYVSHNEIEDLFDVSFLEHLIILDMEGNNVKDADQLNYLRRCPALEEINLKDNPVSKEVSYYQRIQENVPKIKSLDDDLIMETNYFEKKTEEAKVNNLKKNLDKPNQKSPAL